MLALDRLEIIELRAHNRYRLKVDKTFRWRPNGPVMQYFRQHAVGDYFDGGFDGDGEMLMLVHGHIAKAQAVLLNDRLADKDKLPYTLVIGMRSWLFSAFRALLRAPS